MMKTVAETIAKANEELPSPPTSLTYESVDLHEVTGRNGDPVVIAFGILGFKRMLAAVNAYTENHLGAPQPHVGKDTIQGCLERLTYARVAYVAEEPPEGRKGTFTLDWTQGLTPVTVWTL